MPGISPLDKIRVKVTTYSVLGDAMINLYYARLEGVLNLTDAEVMSDMAQWINILMGYHDNIVTNSVSMGSAVVDVVTYGGVYNTDPDLNTAKIVTTRNVGTFFPNWTPFGTSELYNTMVAASVSLKTDRPKTGGGKSLGGLGEGNLSGGLLTNTVVVNMTSFALFWSLGPVGSGSSNAWSAGVISMVDGDWYPFTGISTITNIPGSRVSRKPGRGA